MGRPEEETGAHCYGHNKRSIGICLVGRKDFSPEQMLSLFAMVRGLRNKFKLEIENVHGHYEFDGNKTCPNLDMVQLRAEMIFK